MFSIDATVLSKLRPLPERPPPLPTGLTALDALLSGGLPRGQVVEFSGCASSGKSTRAFASGLSALALGQAVFWIEAGPPRFWPICALEEGLSLERFFLLRVKDSGAGVKGAQLLLSCAGACALLVLALPKGFAPQPLKLVQLQRLAEKSGTVLLLLTERARTAPSTGAMVALRMHVQRLPPPRAPLPASRLSVEVLRHKGGATQTSVEEAVHGPDRLRIHSTL